MLPYYLNLFLISFIPTAISTKVLPTTEEVHVFGVVQHYSQKRLRQFCPFVAVSVNVSHKTDDEKIEFAKETVKLTHEVKDTQTRCTDVRELMKGKFKQYWQVLEGEDFAYSLNYVHFIALHACGCDHCFYYVLFASHLNASETAHDEEADAEED